MENIHILIGFLITIKQSYEAATNRAVTSEWRWLMSTEQWFQIAKADEELRYIELTDTLLLNIPVLQTSRTIDIADGVSCDFGKNPETYFIIPPEEVKRIEDQINNDPNWAPY